MYQPRRVADPIEPAVATPAQHLPHSSGPRRALPTLTDRLFTRGGVTLAVITASATAGAVVVGSTGGSAVALGVPSQEQAAALAELATAAPVPRALNAEQLAEPATAVTAKKASATLLSLTRMYTTGSLNVRAKASTKSKQIGRVEIGARVSATAEIDGKYRMIEFDDGFGWVLAGELSDSAPVEAAGTTMAACSRGSRVESRLRKDTVHIYRSVCALFPAVNSYGGWRSGGLPFHKNGRALDIMLTPRAESALGWRIAKYLIKHSRDFNIDHIIFEQKIWTPRSPHWRHMADRGSLNANHYNHVHVAIRA